MYREQAVEIIERHIDNNIASGSLVEQALRMAIDALSQPEIVRCGACVHFQCNMRFDGSVPKGADAYECRHWCGGCDPMDYCSYGERAERRTE